MRERRLGEGVDRVAGLPGGEVRGDRFELIVYFDVGSLVAGQGQGRVGVIHGLVLCWQEEV